MLTGDASGEVILKNPKSCDELLLRGSTTATNTTGDLVLEKQQRARSVLNAKQLGLRCANRGEALRYAMRETAQCIGAIAKRDDADLWPERCHS